MPKPVEFTYAETINRAAMKLLAMSFRPELKASLIDEIGAAVAIRGGQIDNQWLANFDLRIVFEEIAERTMAILSVVLRQRLPNIADEMDAAFGESLRDLLELIRTSVSYTVASGITPIGRPARRRRGSERRAPDRAGQTTS